MDVEVVKTCPLGHTCRKVVGDKIEECMWYIHLIGVSPQTGKEIDEANCAMSWQPILMVENSRQSKGISAAVESLRNETVKNQTAALQKINGLDNAKTISSQ